MSRIGNNPIPVPSGVQVQVDGGIVSVKGPKGTLAHPLPAGIAAAVEGGSVVVSRTGDEPEARALHGLARALLANAVTGVTAGFKRELEIIGVGYKAEVKSARELMFSLGFSHQVSYKVPEGISVSYDAKANRLTIEGVDKQRVGQVAAEIRGIRPPDVYKGKGVRYAGEHIKLKAGKTGA
jgi:large subunit ribosomal protein L6